MRQKKIEEDRIKAASAFGKKNNQEERVEVLEIINNGESINII